MFLLIAHSIIFERKEVLSPLLSNKLASIPQSGIKKKQGNFFVKLKTECIGDNFNCVH
ncbi:MAG: hypothetical protein BWY90_00475 [Deltaproteobacteria bacterium ADurb.BinA014]|nr:MAG: hypothetical protein BWY90_00475 [Deltaproteobacteria bacterium ADurb.BinA014]